MIHKENIFGTGPKRTKLKTFCKLGNVDSNVLNALYNETLKNSSNEIGSDSYGITKNIDFSKTFGVNVEDSSYRQILLQTADNNEHLSEFSYTKWKDEFSDIRTMLSKYFHNVYRFRISIMQPETSIKWHIDTDTSLCCRAQICISGEDSILEFKTRNGIESLNMRPGEMAFINTAWPHRVVAQNDLRISAIFSFRFEDIKNSEIIYNEFL
jgi:hypothetical protein